MDDEIWKIQYENMIKLLSDEATRFWTRFQIFLAVNGALLAVFPIVLGLYSDTLQNLSEFTKSMLIVISLAGITESILWLAITFSGRETHNYYRNKIIELEDMNDKVNFSVQDTKEDRKKHWIRSIIVISLGLPILFVLVWVSILLLGLSNDFGMIIQNSDSG